MSGYNHGIAHISFQAGGRPFCGNRRAVMCFKVGTTGGLDICRRCNARWNEMQAKTARAEGKE